MSPANAAFATTILAASVLWTLSQYTYRLRTGQTGSFVAQSSSPAFTVQQLLSVTVKPTKICDIMIKVQEQHRNKEYCEKQFLAIILL